MKQFDIKVSLSPNLKNSAGVYPSVEVDLIGVSAADLPRWQNEVGVSNYFAPVSDERARAANRVAFLLGDQHPNDSSFKRDGKTWEAWDKQKPKPMYLVVLCNYPRLDLNDPADRRRRIIPLDCVRWDDEKFLEIVVEPAGLSVSPAPKPSP